MARPVTTTDVFGAVAEPQRRRILGLLARGERSVGQIAGSLRVRQPQASKHLKVLKEVGLVRVREEGRRRLYRLDGQGLKPVHDWVKAFERFWDESFDRLDDYLKELDSLKELKSEGESDGRED